MTPITRVRCALLLCATTLLAGACADAEAPESAAETPDVAEAPAVPPTTTCFAYRDEYLTLDVRLTLAEDGTVTGRQVGFNETPEGYSAGYESSLTGVREGDQLRLVIETTIEGDVQREEAVWTLDGETLDDGSHTLTAVACEDGDQAMDTSPAEGAASHCRDGERAVFSCPVEGSDKVVSVCVSEDYGRQQGYVQYRFGRLGDVELAYPEGLQGTQERFQWQTVGYSGGWDTRVQFENGGYAYQIYDRAIKKTISEKDLEGGVLVMQGGRVVTRLACDEAALGPPYLNTLNDLYDTVPEGTFFEPGD